MSSHSFIINRISLRLHDNNLYKNHKNSQVIFFINKDIKYSPHQYSLLLKAIYLHANSFQKKLCCFHGTSNEFIEELKTKIPKNSNLILDDTDDPINWKYFDDKLSKYFVTHYESSLTMFDWNDKKNKNIIKEIFSKTIYPKIISFKKKIDILHKQYISNHKSQLFIPNHNSFQFFESKNKNWISFENLLTIIKAQDKSMIDSGLKLFNFPKMPDKSYSSNFDLEKQILKYFKITLQNLKSNSWYKPDTYASASLHSNEYGNQQTSKCSFLFALGMLSASKVYVAWGNTIPSLSKLGSATDQLIWREFYHASSKMDGFWGDLLKEKPFWEKTHKWTPSNTKILNNWKNGTTDKHDTNIAMCQLKKEGWIHHLQRHVVADYLTRGFLNYDWKIGEAWFKETLIDHDAPVNRANWMWLAAVAFSSKQKILHYNHNDYIQRHSKSSKNLNNHIHKINNKTKKGGNRKNSKKILKNKKNVILGIHIFTRDLRIQDNLALHELAQKCDKIIGIFVFTPEQVLNNDYKSDRAVKFMTECINELSNEIPLNIFEGNHVDILNEINKKYDIKAISISKDYTPYSNKREEKINKFCKSEDILFLNIDNHCISNPQNIFSGSKNPYQIFTPYYNESVKHKNILIPPTPSKTLFIQYKKTKIHMNKYYKDDTDLGLFHGGRTHGLKKLDNLIHYKQYETIRNRIDKESTRLSAYLKFGVIGIRETYKSIKEKLGSTSEPLLRELHFRDFYMYIAHHFPHVFGNNFKQDKNYDTIWNNDKKYIEAWKKGNTGVPIVDAAMRELNETGFMHNRGRMIVAMFLTKNLLCDWRIGEKYFAQNLIDYDPCSNNGGWQWSASTGADGSPYTRIMNPFTQFEKVDPNADYSKKLVPEIKDLNINTLRKWEEMCNSFDINYKCPIVDVKNTRKKAIQLFSS